MNWRNLRQVSGYELLPIQLDHPIPEDSREVGFTTRDRYPEGSGTSRTWREGDAIRLAIAIRTPGVLAVRMECLYPMAAAYYSAFLRTILEEWPDTRDDIVAQAFSSDLRAFIPDTEWQEWQPILATAQLGETTGRPSSEATETSARGKRGPNFATLAKVAKTIFYMSEHRDDPQYVACQVNDIGPKTFRKYRDDPQYRQEIIRILQRLQEGVEY